MLFLLTFTACSSSSSGGNPVGPTDDSGSGADTLIVDDSGTDAPVDAPADVPASTCTAALQTLLGPIDKVSTGVVNVLSDTGGVKKLYVDASAGGFGHEGANPRIFVDLGNAKRVDLTDVQAEKDATWDLAIKRPVLFSNDGDGGPGAGGVLEVAKAFDAVTSADATGTFKTESFVDKDCNPKTDPTGAVLTTMSDWYDYDAATSKVTPKPGVTYIVRGGGGALYKLAILDYYATPTGGSGTLGGYYLLEVAAL